MGYHPIWDFEITILCSRQEVFQESRLDPESTMSCKVTLVMTLRWGWITKFTLQRLLFSSPRLDFDGCPLCGSSLQENNFRGNICHFSFFVVCSWMSCTFRTVYFSLFFARLQSFNVWFPFFKEPRTLKANQHASRGCIFQNCFSSSFRSFFSIEGHLISICLVHPRDCQCPVLVSHTECVLYSLSSLDHTTTQIQWKNTCSFVL